METTLITHTDGTKSIRYSRDPVEVTHGIATYFYKELPDEKVKEIEEASTDKVQDILSKL